jgi:hypothetical protein
MLGEGVFTPPCPLPLGIVALDEFAVLAVSMVMGLFKVKTKMELSSR